MEMLATLPLTLLAITLLLLFMDTTLLTAFEIGAVPLTLILTVAGAETPWILVAV